MAYYSVLSVTPTDDSWIPDYLPVAGPLIEKHGGTYLARTASHEQLEGKDRPAGLRIILEWPSEEAAKAFMSDPAYSAALAARHAGSVSEHFLIEGKDDLA